MPFFSTLLAQQGPPQSPLTPQTPAELRGPFEAILGIFKEIFPALLNVKEAIGEFLGVLFRALGGVLLGILHTLNPEKVVENIVKVLQMLAGILKTLLDLLPPS
ncbi:MAG: hypothetical protein A2991_00545 [Candidatus Terrybacteria bacterium RIFCSPLOWO2_01_FULL_58_14]|uniref:Uncharacterized protein n=2 Tax=Candidatus Terryibacteriota TaxID=1817920 RepID=A0A1G2PWA6_9BACT|nr:MAG: hypothetical protein A2682_01110 [Candidatus Terrybacteria bacterium RIFCSPHIGHO2_01_FULL_58_15]OHA52606.1 MAG: hypothetical protein A2991_00545 [Candidatus Terrybacteria bacterium RIFCSPLOWO2_01_FULL_58_14]